MLMVFANSFNICLAHCVKMLNGHRYLLLKKFGGHMALCPPCFYALNYVPLLLVEILKIVGKMECSIETSGSFVSHPQYTFVKCKKVAWWKRHGA